MSLRPYQEDSINQIREEFAKGYKRVLLWLSTGAGKTVCFCEMIKKAEEKKLNTLVVVRGRKLVQQASDRLFREKVDHGVLMAGSWNYRPNLRHQVASIDTLISRELCPKADLIIIDECHLANSPGYKKFLAKYPEAYIVSVTATPWLDKGLRHIAQTFVHPITMDELIREGHLVKFRAFAPSAPDLTHVSIMAGTKDYNNDELQEAMSKGSLTGDIIEHWKKLASDRPTICFAVNIKHSRIIVDRFLEAGISAEHCDADTSDEERNEIIKRLEDGRTKVVCNVGILCIGVDIPSLGAIIMARPTKSRNLFVQQAGRGTRTFKGKTDCLLLDHAGNCHQFDGLPTVEPELDLDGSPEREKAKKESKTCEECFAVYIGKNCPECGHEPETFTVIPKENIKEELRELKFVEKDPYLIELKKMQSEAKAKGHKTAAAYYRFFNKFGIDISKKYLPEWFTRKFDDAFGNSPFKGAAF